VLKRFLNDAAVYGVAAILSRGIAFILLPLYTHRLAPADFGTADLFAVLTSLANVTVALEISQAVARFQADAQTTEERAAVASTALWFTVGCYAVLSVAVAAAAGPVSVALLGAPARPELVRLALATAVAYGFFYLLQNQLRWDLRPRAYAVASVALTGVTVGASLVLVMIYELGVRGVLMAQLAGNAAGVGIAFAFARRSYRFAFDWSQCRRMLAFSLPLVPSSVAVFVALYVDRLALKQLTTLADVGLFGVGYRLASAVGLVLVGFQSALTPLVYAHHAEPDTPAQLARIFRLFAAIALAACAGVAVFAPEIVALVSRPSYYAAAAVVPLLAPAVLLAQMYVFAPGLALAKRTRRVAALNLGGAALNSGLNFALIPLLGIRGAAVATLVGAAATFAGYMVMSQRLYPVPHRWARLAASTAAVAAAAAVAARLGAGTPAAVAAKLALLAATAVVFVRVRLVEPAELRRVGRALRARGRPSRVPR
jgi:O-antigen/teichoic acid export membrane protein